MLLRDFLCNKLAVERHFRPLLEGLVAAGIIRGIMILDLHHDILDAKTVTFDAVSLVILHDDADVLFTTWATTDRGTCNIRELEDYHIGWRMYVAISNSLIRIPT